MDTSNSTAIQKAFPHPNEYLNAILWGGWHWSGGDAITYYFFDSLSDRTDVENWTDVEKAAYRAALQSWANVANVTFQEVSTPDANFLEVLDSAEELDASGRHVTPGPEFLEDPEYLEELTAIGAGRNTAVGQYAYNGDGWDKSDPNGGLAIGGVGYYTLVHELGHGLGLAHPHDTGGGSTVFPGITPGTTPEEEARASRQRGENDLNQDIFTVMSYVRGELGTGWTKPVIFVAPGVEKNFGHVAGPMAFDIAAIQYLYGANLGYHTGNDTYQLPDTNALGTFWTCIWDAGGVDGIVYSGSRDVVINLTAATLDNSPTGGGVPSRAVGIFGGFTIANGVVIENAHSGSGHDKLFGNQADNTLSGSAGNDWFAGGPGDDDLDGGAGLDTAFVHDTLAHSILHVAGSSIGTLISYEGTDELFDVERVRLDDGMLALDLEGNGGQAYRVYQIFDRKADQEGLGYWIDALDTGKSLLSSIAFSFIYSAELQATYGAPDTVSNQQFITLLYANVLNRAPDQAGFDYWMNNLKNAYPREALLVSISESAESKQNVIGAIENGIEYIPWLT